MRAGNCVVIEVEDKHLPTPIVLLVYKYCTVTDLDFD